MNMKKISTHQVEDASQIRVWWKYFVSIIIIFNCHFKMQYILSQDERKLFEGITPVALKVIKSESDLVLLILLWRHAAWNYHGSRGLEWWEQVEIFSCWCPPDWLLQCSTLLQEWQGEEDSFYLQTLTYIIVMNYLEPRSLISAHYSYCPTKSH